MKKALIISNFYTVNNFKDRTYCVNKFLSNHYKCKIVCSDFSHHKKEKVNNHSDNCIVISTKEYKKNISIKRVVSHYCFAKDVYRYIRCNDIDLIYVMVPPNLLGYFVTKICKKKSIKLIVDVVDLWPESLPIKTGLKKVFEIFTFNIWGRLREYAIKYSNALVLECDYYKKILKIDKLKTFVIPIVKDSSTQLKKYKFDFNCISIAYIGGINTIYDFDSLIGISRGLIEEGKRVKIEIIGDGDKRKWLISQLEKYDIPFEYHGIIYDEEKKHEILSKCIFGYNGFKVSTEVALSYKSIDYLSEGLLLINSAKYDTYKLVEKEKIGFNFDSNNIDKIIEEIKLLSVDQILDMREKACNIFLLRYSYKAYTVLMDEVIKKL